MLFKYAHQSLFAVVFAVQALPCVAAAESAPAKEDSAGSRAPAKIPEATGPVDYARDVRPLLSDRCFQCHGPDAEHRKASLRLDQRSSAFGKAESGEVPIVAGKPEASELIRRISSTDKDERMPPADSSKSLSPTEIAVLRRWIAEGARWQEHWAFARPVRPEVSAVKDLAWCRNDIDHFVLSRLEAERLHPSPEASRETLIRRVTFGLTGLPPTLAEIDAFVADNSANAYEKVVDRLLASRPYGEHMTAHWLDGARYADTNGFQNDFARDMWPWRDWVIEAFNANMPYDAFIREQVAGDLVPGSTPTQKMATGFCRNNRSVTEAGSIEEEWHVENVIDRVETTSALLMGLTMGCARCHDHKYDPITQQDFYRYFAFFNSTKDQGFYNEKRGNTGPMVRIVRPQDERELKELDAQIAAAGMGKQFDSWLKRRRDKALPAELPLPKLAVPLAGNLKVAGGEVIRPDASAASGNVQQAAYRGGKARWSVGLPGEVLELAGEPAVSVELGQAVKFERNAPFSIACWVRPESDGAIWSKMDDALNFRGFDAMLTGGGRMFVHIVHQWTDNALKVTTAAKLRQGEWNHVCVTYDGSSKAKGVKIYFDGKSVPLTIDVDALKDSIETSQPLRLGRRSNSLQLKGAIGDFVIYDRVLCGSQVTALLNKALAKTANSSKPAKEAVWAMRDFYAATESEAGELKLKLISLRNRRDQYVASKMNSSVMVMEELPKPRPTYLLKRGQYDHPDKNITLQPGLPSFLPPLPSGVPANRLALANWLISPDHPLVSRVEVNRLWQQLFGVGLIRTPDNLGMQGEAASHPELLDWLATELVRLKWNVKALQKEIVMSAAYRQASAVTPDMQARDPENRLLARGPRHRLSAEAIRDRALAASGLLSLKIGGPSVKPYQPAGLWAELAGGAGGGDYQRDIGENLHRRSLYTYRKRTVPHPTTSTFDAPSWEICTVKRSRTNTPLQALALLNDETYVEAARGLGQRMMLEGGSAVEDRVRYGFRLATGRLPHPAETSRLTASYRRYMAMFHDDPKGAEKLLTVGELKPDVKLNRTELAAYSTLASVLLNLDESITTEQP